MNKKAYLRIIESVIAIILTFVFILIILPKGEIETPKNLDSLQDTLANGIEQNEILRISILDYPAQSTLENLENSRERKNLENYLTESTKDLYLEFNFTVCDEKNLNCNPDFFAKDSQVKLPAKDIYARSIMVANTTIIRIFRLYIWEKY